MPGVSIALVVLVSLIGFWEWRSALLLALSIPITLAMTFGMASVLNIDLQQVSIASLIIALGLLVDRVSQVTKVPVDSVEPPPEEVVTAETDFLTGVARWDSRLIMLLDLDKVLLPNA